MSVDFKIVCTECWELTEYDALDNVSGLPCNKCGKKL
jgi:DNA-directed RNA polymerase subunit RPC12/RpoP